MAKHIRLFQNETEFNAARASEYVEPWLSYTETKGVDYNKQGPLDPFNGYAYVDLGLPSGTLWAECNLGVNSKEELGNRLSWGQSNGQGNYDDLKLENDAVHINMGGDWHTPSASQIDELIDYTTVETGIINGKKGLWVISTINSNKIFLPVENNTESAIYMSKSYYKWDSGSPIVFGLGVYYDDVELDYDNDCPAGYGGYFRGVVG